MMFMISTASGRGRRLSTSASSALRRLAYARGIQHDEQLHQVVRRSTGRLDDEDVAAADVLVELDRDLAVFEPGHFGVPERHVQVLANRDRQPAAGVAREEAARIHA